MDDRARILIVDDEPHLRFAVGLALRAAGYDVSEAEDGPAGLALTVGGAAAGNPFDVVLMDLDIPKMSGLEVIDRIREKGIGSRIFVVTGFAERSVVDALHGRDGVDVLFKPFDPRHLVERIRTLLARDGREAHS